MNEKKNGIDCFACQHFYITWDSHYPKGCKQYNFKTDQMPSYKVQQAIGGACPGFMPKK